MKITFKPHHHYQLIYFLRGIALGLILLGFISLTYTIYPIVKAEASFFINQRLEPIHPEPTPAVYPSTFGQITLIPPTLKSEPVNTVNSIVIDKIDVNVPIVWDVTTRNANEYFAALNNGVAHALGTQRPSENAGNTYLFAHSTLNPLEIEQFSAVFTLLHRLEIGDRITVFSENKRFDYLVEESEVVRSFNTEPLKRQPDYPMLTLQTCDPPGIPLNRLIITARLYEVYEN